MKYDLLMWKQFATLDVESRIGKISVNMTVIMRSLKTQVIFIFHQIPGKKNIMTGTPFYVGVSCSCLYRPESSNGYRDEGTARNKRQRYLSYAVRWSRPQSKQAFNAGGIKAALSWRPPPENRKMSQNDELEEKAIIGRNE